MKILITAATSLELQKIREKAKSMHNCNIDFCITGTGCAFTAYMLTKKLQNAKFDLVLNIGIAGSFAKDIAIGATVIVENEIFGNLGITYPNKFSTLFDENFINANEYPFTNGKLFCKYVNCFNITNLRSVCGLTVDAASGEQNQIDERKKMFNADIETMEGAAFFYVCLSEKIPFLEIRTISNCIEPRNKNKWKVSLAIENLTAETFNLLNNLQLPQTKIIER
ncbi:MAG: futalosine hydrolase [Prevotellaceae bacterium]|jgi:futalosine hydrolase|nr:futalosine hydrolase [Prevotellaceae bacterium]